MSNILIVDNDTSLREVLYDLLTRKGCKVLAASLSGQAFELLKTHRPDVILLDMGVSKRSVLEVAKRIRAFDASVPILLLRGTGVAEIIVEECQQLGHVYVLRKELGIDLFLSAVERMLIQIEDLAVKGKKLNGPHLTGRFLVVDDDAAARRMLKLIFESHGFEIILAGSGEEALEALGREPQLVMLDVTMPGMDGLMTLKRIKEISPDLPVIMVSAHDDKEIVREALAVGAYDYVTKPFSVEYLETIVMTKMLVGMKN